MKKYNITQAVVYDGFWLNQICSRKLKKIISIKSPNNIIGQEILICDSDKAYGIVILNEPYILDADLFKNNFSKHIITEECKNTIWPNINKFYSFSFRIKKIFKEPIEYKSSKARTMGDFIEDVKLIQEDSINYKEIENIETIIKYEDKLETFKSSNCDSGDELLKGLFMEVYELYIKKIGAK